MTVKYMTLLTQAGTAKLANAAALGKMLNITHMGVGDGGGNPTTPDPAQTALINERRRAVLNGLRVDPSNPNQIIAEQVIPENEGGFWLREIGLYDDDGDLIAVANCPDTYKPQLQEGSGRVQTIRMILVVSNTSAVTLKVDPSVVMATRKSVDDKAIEVKAYADELMAKHLANANPHKQYAPIESPVLTGNPLAPTPPLFDADSSIATTAFVQRALGNMKSAFGVRENQVLTSDAFGCFVEAQIAGITITLPNSSLCIGGVIEFNNISNGAVTISGTGGNILGPNNPSGSNTMMVNSGTNIRFLSTGPQWRAIGGVGTVSLGKSGYQRLPSGLLMQWGSGSSNASGQMPVIFPVAFTNPDVNYHILATHSGSGSGVVIERYDVRTLTGTRLDIFYSTNAAIVGPGAIIHWLAIGV
ncbi:phage tail protein [Dickeya chrysanthemi]|uniref:phage tail protein n=1 Tax=Dickeya chrysanthemi TaxID=556 RepID=UPI000532BF10|nr:phage tail protein [Dickeya chrysanthemi]